MKLTEKNKYLLKKIIFSLLLITFWVLTAIHIFKLEDGKEIAIGVLYIFLFLPITFSILLDFEVFSLFIIILYEIAMLLMGIIILSMGLASKEIEILEMFALACEILFALFIISSAIQYLRNKNHTLKIITLVMTVAHLVFVIISFIQNNSYDFETWYDFLKNVVIILVFSLYIITFPDIQLKIFKEDK